MTQEKKLWIPDPNPIAVFKLAASNWYVVHERAVKTVKISNDKVVTIALDLGMLPGDWTNWQAKCGSPVSADDCRRICKREHGSPNRSGYGNETRVHRCTRYPEVVRSLRVSRCASKLLGPSRVAIRRDKVSIRSDRNARFEALQKRSRVFLSMLNGFFSACFRCVG